MKKNTVQQIIIALLFSAFLVIFFLFSLNGRYQPLNESALILDTRTGKIFAPYDPYDKSIIKYTEKCSIK